MRKLFSLILTVSCLWVNAQNNLTTNIIEGSKAIVEIVKVFKSSKQTIPEQPASTKFVQADSCYSKAIADICYKNTSGKTMQISLYKRTGNSYAVQPLVVKMSDKSQECLYELQAGIYKFKIEYEDDDEEKVVYREGEIKLQGCDKLIKEIKFE